MHFDSLTDHRSFASLQTLRSMQQQLAHLFDEPDRSPTALAFALYERPGAVLLRTALPGFEAKDIALEIDGNALTLSGSWPDEPEGTGAQAQHQERPRGAFRRTLRFAFEIDAARVQARFERGVLEIEVPHLEKAPAVKIRVLPEARGN